MWFAQMGSLGLVVLSGALTISCYHSHRGEEDRSPPGCVVEPICRTGRLCLVDRVQVPWDPRRGPTERNLGIVGPGLPGQVWATIANRRSERPRYALVDLNEGRIVQEHVIPRSSIPDTTVPATDGTLYLRVA